MDKKEVYAPWSVGPGLSRPAGYVIDSRGIAVTKLRSPELAEEVSRRVNAHEYPGEGDPWADFLHYRAICLDAFSAEGKSDTEIARIMSMDPMQVRMILLRSR